jgi:lon-related putative ATP-dependent protease
MLGKNMGLKKASMYKGLDAEELKWIVNPAELNYEEFEFTEGDEVIIGQEKAIKALQVGIEIKSPGYNIFITGLSGTGKLTTIKKLLEVISPVEADLKDYVYVNNFNDEDRPTLLELPAGTAVKFKKDMFHMVKFLKENIPSVLEAEPYLNRKRRLVDYYNQSQQKLYNQFENKLHKDGFVLGQSQNSEIPQPEIMIEKENKMYYIQQLDELLSNKLIDKHEATSLAKKYSGYQQELQIVLKKSLSISREYQQKLYELEKDHTTNIIDAVLDEIRSMYNFTKITEYLEQVKQAIFENLDVFVGRREATESTREGVIIDYLKSFEVNVILDNSETKGTPVITETYPTYSNLFGTIDKMSDGSGGWYSDFTRIKSGALLRANNGYLILRALDTFNEPGVWNTLKRVLLYGFLEMQDQSNFFQVVPGVLKPEPIKINTKIIFIGNNDIYSLLSNYEDDFNKIFKVKAEFDYEMNRTNGVTYNYIGVLNTIINKENLMPFNVRAISKLLEYSARYAGNKNKLTTRFAYILDLMLESDFWAKNDGDKEVDDKHIKQAYEAMNERHGLGNIKITEMIEDGMILIDTEGERVGQINGLAVYGDGIYSFGKPTRITASVSIGSGNIINVERESGLSGSTHNKGVLIISGYIRELFGKHIPLNFNASLVFEQGYGMIDGDSASVAEIAALISCLSEVPITQSLAVTGSVNQKGDIQPIGGVNEKIEGFYDICKLKGLTGKQGVIIPFQNKQDLMLKDEVIEAVKERRFNIYSAQNIEEALELLLGVKVSRRNLNGKFEKDTLFYIVEQKLTEMLKKSKQSGTTAKSTNKKGAKPKINK